MNIRRRRQIVQQGLRVLFAIIVTLLAVNPLRAAIPAGSALTYQGRLVQDGVPYDGSADLLISLIDAESVGVVIGSPQQFKNVVVTNGLFTVQVDFGFVAYDGDARWLEIQVRAPHDPADALPFIALTPRQPLSATPFALQTKGIHVDHSTGFVGIGRKLPIFSTEVFGLYRPTTGFGGMYVQTDPQGLPYYGYATTGGIKGYHYFNDGDGAWRLMLGVNQRLKVRNDGLVEGSIFNATSQFTINESHALSMTGAGNLFAGANAGSNSAATNNSIFGQSAGENSGSGSNNAFFGYQSGFGNSSGDRNCFFGSDSGYSNGAGVRNSFFGWSAGLNNTASNNAFFGPETGRSNTSGTQNAFFARSGFANTTGSRNSFFGYASGFDNTTASDNSFFGHEAGRLNTTGGGNTFAGARAGRSNVTHQNNSFFGVDAGRNSIADGNSFFGRSAGYDTTTGTSNSFFGRDAGRFNTVGNLNSFFGSSAGQNNLDGGLNSFYGVNSGHDNTSGNSNSFFGYSAGFSNTTGDYNSFFGTGAGQENTQGVNNACFGFNAGNQLSVGDNNSLFGFGAGSAVSSGQKNCAFGTNAGDSIGSADENVYVGYWAGMATTGDFNTFVGSQAGRPATTGDNNTFVGSLAGVGVTTGANNTFVGRSAGGVNLAGTHCVSIGYFSETSGTGNTALGATAAVNNAVSYGTAVGYGAQCNNPSSVVLGRGTDTVRIPGNLVVSGSVSKGGGSFRIDHPLDPENKWLYHSFVESPDMMNVYNGNVTTDGEGRAVVELPEYFEALNRDFRYQLTVIGQFAQAIVSDKVADNRFGIRTDKPGVEVSWQVTGIRQDRWANEHRIRAEETKPERERGNVTPPKTLE